MRDGGIKGGGIKIPAPKRYYYLGAGSMGWIVDFDLLRPLGYFAVFLFAGLFFYHLLLDICLKYRGPKVECQVDLEDYLC